MTLGLSEEIFSIIYKIIIFIIHSPFSPANADFSNKLVDTVRGLIPSTDKEEIKGIIHFSQKKKKLLSFLEFLIFIKWFNIVIKVFCFLYDYIIIITMQYRY